MTMESRQSLEKLRAIADITNALVVQRAELVKLREAVRRAEEAAVRKTAKQRHHEIISTAYRAKADALEMEAQAKHRLAWKDEDTLVLQYDPAGGGDRKSVDRKLAANDWKRP